MDTELEGLRGWDSGARIAAELYDRLQTHPRYAEAIHALAQGMLTACDASPVAGGVIRDAGRRVSTLCAAYLDSSGGLTLPRLQAMMTDFGLASPGRARALLLDLQRVGLVELRARAHATSPARYRLTDAFRRFHEDHLRIVCRAAAVIEPAVHRIADHLDRPDVYAAYVAETTQAFLTGTRQGHNQDRYYRVFMHPYAGTQIMYTLLTAAPPRTPPFTGDIPFATAATARRFGVSVEHVRRLLAAGAAEGLLTRHRTYLRFTEAGLAAVNWIFSTQFILYLQSSSRTLSRVSLPANVVVERDLRASA